MSEKYDKNQKPDAILNAKDKPYDVNEDDDEIEDEPSADEAELYYDEDEEYEDEEYEAAEDSGDDEDEEYEDDEDEAGQAALDPYVLAQQLASSPMFAQVQALLGGGGSIAAKLGTAQLQQASGDLEGAAEIYLDVIDEDPENHKANVALGQVLLAMDKPEQAETFLHKAIDLDPEDAPSHLYLGYAHYAQQNFEQCIEDFRQATELDPGNIVAFNNLGYAEYLTGRLDEAEKTFIRAGDVGSNRAYYNLGMVRLLKGDEPKSLEAYNDAAELDPYGSQIDDHLADLEQAKQRFPERTELLDRAIERFQLMEDADDEDIEDEDDEYAPKD